MNPDVPEQAIEILNNAAALAMLSRSDHAAVMRSAETLRRHFAKPAQSGPSMPE